MRALVLTVSDRSARGERADATGPAVAERLRGMGHDVAVEVVEDDAIAIAEVMSAAVGDHDLVVLAGGTGLGPRDVTPQAVQTILDYEIPGFGELMRAEGRRSTPLAALSRSLAGVAGRTLVLVVPGSPRGAVESLDAVAPLLPHALDTLAGGDHEAPAGADRRMPGARPDRETNGERRR